MPTITTTPFLSFSVPIPVAQGGTGATTAAGARTNLGLGTFAVENIAAVPALTLAGTISGAGQNLNNIIIGAVTPLAGSFTTVGASGLISANGGQIAFPATEAASAGANTLDDYEEGTFTPGLTFGGGSTGMTFGSQVGSYTKIGNMVTFTLRVTLTAKGSSTGAAVITALPFTVGGRNHPASVWMSAITFANIPLALVNTGATTIALDETTEAAGVTTVLADTNFADTSDIMVSGTYFV